jgi:Na+/phosphate symporter
MRWGLPPALQEKRCAGAGPGATLVASLCHASTCDVPSHSEFGHKHRTGHTRHGMGKCARQPSATGQARVAAKVIRVGLDFSGIGTFNIALNKVIFQKTGLAFFYGLFFTTAVQSSTVTTSLVVPLVASKKVTLAKVFPFIIGANIGTTMTAVIASIYKPEAAIALALVHVCFNSIGALIFLPIPVIRKIPIGIANFMGKISMKYRLVVFAYILLTFFIIPFLLIYFTTN